MKKYKKIAYLLLIIIIATVSVITYTNISKGSEGDEKGFSEVEFLETKLVTLLNEMNNIEARNYDVSVSEISKQTKEQSNQSSSSSGNNSQSENNTEGGQSQGETTTSNNSSNAEKGEKFELKASGVLTNTDDINWDNIKSNIEMLYASIPTITLELYQLNLNQDDILNFNKEFDNLTVVAKDEKKQETLDELSKLYEYVPKFMSNVTDEEIEKTIVETKANVFKAYSKLDTKNWDDIGKDIEQSINTYSKLLSNTNIESSKQYSISKGYIMINELKNAVEVKDESVFLIKYKNLLEEMNNL